MTPHLSPRSLAPVAILLLLFALSCGKKGSDSPTAPPTSATATLTGLVIGANGGLPLAGVTITATPSTGVTATTASSGWFTLRVPANTPIAITASHVGFADHGVSLQMTSGESRALTLVLPPFGVTTNLAVSSGGDVTDAGAKTRLHLPADFTSGTSNAFVDVTGLDPTTSEALGMPGTLDAENSTGTVLSLEPAAVAEVRIDDGLDTGFPLLKPADLYLHLPASFASDLRYANGNSVPCFQYDETSGRWKPIANGVVVASPVDGLPSVKVTISHLTWFAAGFLNGSSGCVSGKILSGGVGAGGVTVEAFPGGLDVTAADGSYRVSTPPGANVQILATRPGTGTVTIATTATIGGTPGGGCTTETLSLGTAAPPPTYTIEADLLRVYVPPLTRDEVGVHVVANTTPSPLPLDGCVVQIGDGSTWKTIPGKGNGLYFTQTGMPGAIFLAPNTVFTLRVDLEPDGVFDATSSVRMPGKPVITAPAEGALVGPSFAAAWTDPAAGLGGYSAHYIGSIESNSFGTVPVRFVVDTPAASFDVGTGSTQPQYFASNDPLNESGAYTFRLFATNGPVRYPSGGGNLVFATPNVTPTAAGATNILGWFSAQARADSIDFASLGSGTRPRLAMRNTRGR